jgi:hypothetical protein
MLIMNEVRVLKFLALLEQQGDVLSDKSGVTRRRRRRAATLNLGRIICVGRRRRRVATLVNGTSRSFSIQRTHSWKLASPLMKNALVYRHRYRLGATTTCVHTNISISNTSACV